MFTKCLNELKRRRWEHLRSKWLNYLPTLGEAGAAPATVVSEVLDRTQIPGKLLERVKAAGPQPGLIAEFDEVQGLRETVFWESLFLLHKARHVLGASEFLVADGMRTWGVADSYQAAFFGAKATLGFLGISFPEIQSKTMVIDLFPRPVIRSEDYIDCAFYYIGHRLDHRLVWEMFQRILGVSTVECWPTDITNKLKSCESKYFAKQRNDIHYKNHGWIFNDLHQYDVEEGFGALRHSATSNKNLDFGRGDISLVLAITILKFNIALLQDIERSSRKLSPEIELLNKCVEDGRHPLYGDCLLK